MTEAKWLKCEDPEELFKLVMSTRRTGQRVYRLFATGFWDWQRRRLTPKDQQHIDALGVRVPLLEEWAETGKQPKGIRPNREGILFFNRRASTAAQDTVRLARQWTEKVLPGVLCALLREVFGNPFRRVKLNRAWLTSDVVALAKGIYAERAFDRMPILADALQDAGCDSEQVLNHCRDESLLPREPKKGQVPAVAHVRGCWVLDLLLEKR